MSDPRLLPRPLVCTAARTCARLVAALLSVATALPVVARAEAAAPLPAAATAADTAADTAAAAEESPLDVAVRDMIAGKLQAALARLEALEKDPSDPARQAVAARLAAQIRKARPDLAARGAADALSGPAKPNQEGRTALLATTTALGLTLYGGGLPVLLDTSDGRATVGVYLLTAGSSFLLPYFGTRHEEVTWGMANMAFSGGTSGAIHGLLVSALLEKTDDQFAIGSAMLGSMIELGAGTWWASHSKMTAGDAHLHAVATDLGAAWLAGLGNTFLPSDQPDRDRLLAGASLLGAAGGFAGAAFLAPNRKTTWGDAEVIRTSALLGGFAGLTISSWADDIDTDTQGRRTIALTTLVSMAAAAGGDWLVRDTDFGLGEALLVDLGTLAGGLVTAGVTYLVTNSDEPSTYLTAALLGGGAGFGLSYWAQQSGPSDKRTARALDKWLDGVQLPGLVPTALQGGDGRMAPGLAIGGGF